MFDSDEVVPDTLRGDSRLAVGAYISTADGRLLVLRRARDEYLGGLMEIPSGSVEQGEGMFQALRREVFEETGLVVLDIITALGHVEYQLENGTKTRQYNFVVRTNDPVNTVLSPEHDQFRLVGSAETEGLDLDPFAKTLVQRYFNWARKA